ncbi:MAG: dihydropteroate synthase [Elusimicrobiota bacterium]
MAPLLSKRSRFESLRFSGLRRPLVMGILNVTPDSFYRASRLSSTDAAVEAGLRMEEAGADLLDVGGESTRPGSEPVSAEVPSPPSCTPSL